MGKKSLHEEINEFFQTWDGEAIVSFFRDVEPLMELYDIEEEADWITEFVTAGEETQVRLVRTVYLVSRIADFHAGKLATLHCKHKNLWRKMEEEAMKVSNIKE